MRVNKMKLLEFIAGIVLFFFFWAFLFVLLSF